MADNNIANTGLRGVTIASTKISDVIGDEGKLIYRGYLAKDIAGKVSFEEICYLLLYEKLPTITELASFSDALKAKRSLPDHIIAVLEKMPPKTLPMDVLQGTVVLLSANDPHIEEMTKENALKSAIRLIARMASIVAIWERIRKGKKPIEPNPDLSHAGNFLYQLTGEIPADDTTSFFDTALVLHAEHSFNASTFAARGVASTKAHMYSAVAAAVGSLSGALHGGANTRVMKMLQEIGSVDKVDNYIKQELDAGRKVMGLGHAVYKTDDPRALILAPMSQTLAKRAGDTTWYDISVELEKGAKKAFKEKKDMDIYVNVDFYSASLYHYMGIPMDLFTPVFAISRISGWAAHFIEEQFGGAAPKPMLYRPESDYVGDYCGPTECVLTDIEKR